jgi:hypothetical protein
MSGEQAAPPPRKKTSGLTILLAVIGGGFLLVVLVVGIVAWRVMSSPTGRLVVGAMGETIRIVQKAQKAPGTRELRAIGCKSAMVLDLDDFEKLMQRFDASTTRAEPPPFGSMVACGVQPWSTPPACDAVAKTYVGAVGPRPKPFLVTVTKSGQQKALCSSLYEGDGSTSREIDDPGASGIVPADGE